MELKRYLERLTSLERRMGDCLNRLAGRLSRFGLKLSLVMLGLLWAVYLVYLVLDGLGLV